MCTSNRLPYRLRCLSAFKKTFMNYTFLEHLCIMLSFIVLFENKCSAS